MIVTARRLAKHGGSNRPRQADLRRAVSTAYYALFHTVCKGAADLLIGGTSSTRSNAAWRQVYRSLDHGRAKKACTNNEVLKRFPKPIEDFGNEFVNLQIKRHDADYNPDATFARSEVLTDIDSVETVIKGYKKVPISDRRAFVAWLTFSTRA